MLKRLDMYKQTKEDFSKSTASGGLFTLFCIAAMIILFIGELQSFLTPQVDSFTYVDAHKDTGNEHAEFQINLNLSLPNLPCAVVSVDSQDVMGTHTMDIGGHLLKTRLDSSTGQPLLDAAGQQLSTEVPALDMKGEGCNLHGDLIVRRVPGNFHVSAHAHANLIPQFFGKTPMNMTHTIHSLSFGDAEAAEQISALDNSVTNPLSGTSRSTTKQGLSFEYHIGVVPTNFHKGSKQSTNFKKPPCFSERVAVSTDVKKATGEPCCWLHDSARTGASTGVHFEGVWRDRRRLAP
jgi:hypothetical protein